MPCKNILTVDVEDWFHICGVTDYIPRETWSSQSRDLATLTGETGASVGGAGDRTNSAVRTNAIPRPAAIASRLRRFARSNRGTGSVHAVTGIVEG